MKTFWRSALALVFFALVVATFGPGCVDNESSLFVHNVLAPSCDILSTDSPEIGIGTLDTRYSCTYTATIVAGNQLVRRGDDNKLQTETSRIELKGVDVQVLDPDGAVVGEFSQPVVGFIDPATNTNPGYGLTQAQLIDGATAQKLNTGGINYVTARIVVRGRTLGGQDLTSATWDFPINVCNGCLCEPPPDDTCIDPQSSPQEQCWIAQDAKFDCRFLGGKKDCTTPGLCGVF